MSKLPPKKACRCSDTHEGWVICVPHEKTFVWVQRTEPGWGPEYITVTTVRSATMFTDLNDALQIAKKWGGSIVCRAQEKVTRTVTPGDFKWIQRT
jgi:hypothetical protein